MRLALVAITVAGCCARAKAPPPVTVIHEPRGCLEQIGPAPAPEQFHSVDSTTDARCSDAWALCADAAAVARLARYLQAVKRWTAEVEARCSTTTTDSPPRP